VGGETGAEGSLLCDIVEVNEPLGVRNERGLGRPSMLLRRAMRVDEEYVCAGLATSMSDVASSSSESNMELDCLSSASSTDWSSSMARTGRLRVGGGSNEV
jgi:hypothetical protein